MNEKVFYGRRDKQAGGIELLKYILRVAKLTGGKNFSYESWNVEYTAYHMFNEILMPEELKKKTLSKPMSLQGKETLNRG